VLRLWAFYEEQRSHLQQRFDQLIQPKHWYYLLSRFSIMLEINHISDRCRCYKAFYSLFVGLQSNVRRFWIFDFPHWNLGNSNPLFVFCFFASQTTKI
jgi:hypothetical protein